MSLQSLMLAALPLIASIFSRITLALKIRSIRLLTDPLQLSEVISMKPSADMDGSEELFVRISNFSIDGVTLVWLDGADPSQIVEVTDGNGNVLYYEIPESQLTNVEVLPPLHSNDDFTFNVEGIVKTAHRFQQVLRRCTFTREQTVIVDVKGGYSIVELNDKSGIWQRFDDGNVRRSNICG